MHFVKHIGSFRPVNSAVYTRRLRDATLKAPLASCYSRRFPHLAAAAFFAISERLFALRFAARAGPPSFPPMRPNAAAAARIASVISTGASSQGALASDLAAIVFITRTAACASSSRRFGRLLDPFGIRGVSVRYFRLSNGRKSSEGDTFNASANLRMFSKHGFRRPRSTSPT